MNVNFFIIVIDSSQYFNICVINPGFIKYLFRFYQGISQSLTAANDAGN